MPVAFYGPLTPIARVQLLHFDRSANAIAVLILIRRTPVAVLTIILAFPPCHVAHAFWCVRCLFLHSYLQSNERSRSRLCTDCNTNPRTSKGPRNTCLCLRHGLCLWLPCFQVRGFFLLPPPQTQQAA